MSTLGFRPFDADHHYYEATDAFTRYIDRKMAKRCMQWAQINGKTRLLVGGRVNKFIPNPTFDPIAAPGSLEDYFRGRNLDATDLKTMFGQLDPISEHPEYRNRDARVKQLDEQGLEGSLLFPTLGVGMQDALRRDVPALHAAFTAFNKWLDDDWGFDRGDGRLYAAPMITFADPVLAEAEVSRVLSAGARVLVTTPGPVPDGDDGYVSPAHPKFDRVWGLIAESGVPMVFHAGLNGLNYGNVWRVSEPGQNGNASFEGFKHSSFPLVAFADRGISDTLASLICHGLLSRFPKLRIASIENGAMWVPDLLRNLKMAYGKMPSSFSEHPVEQFKRQVWISPYYEDDMSMLKDQVGIERLMFGSDFPHTEGLADPCAFVKDIPDFDANETRIVMRENVYEFLGIAA